MARQEYAAFVLREPGTRLGRYLLALSTVTAATLLRFAFDPLLGDQVPYFVYVAAVVVAAWFARTQGALPVVAVSAIVGRFFFIAPRHTIIWSREEVAAMATFVGLSLPLVWLVRRWARAESQLRKSAEELQTIVDTVPAAVLITQDPQSRTIDGNRFAEQLLRLPLGARLSETSRESEPVRSYRLLREGSEIAWDDRPLQMAASRGVDIRNYEFDLAFDDGTVQSLVGNASPLRDNVGRVRGAVGVFVDVTERNRLAAEVWRSREGLRTATLAAEVGVWTWDPRTNVSSVGANWYRLFDIDPDTPVTYERWMAALHPDDRSSAGAALRHAWESQRDYSCEYRVVWRDGSIHWLIDRGRVFRGPDGTPLGVTGVNLDITPRRAAEDALRNASRVKDEFLATLSHELRTPLNAIIGWSDMVRLGKLEPGRATQAIESVYRNAQSLAEMINDVLDVSRIITGKVRVEMKPVDPSEILLNALDAVRGAADAKRIAIVTDIASVPFPVLGDPTRLQQIFWNLLSNAVKFTLPNGRIGLSLRVFDEQIQVRVSDSGIGISPEFLPHVFERFRQGDSSTTRSHSGLGLGLAIVRHLVEMHGGTVAAESRGQGLGSVFTVTLPAHRFEERRHGAPPVSRHVIAVEAPNDEPPGLCGVRVLVVDDEEEARALATAVLHHHGATVQTAASAAQALPEISRFRPTVLLVDLAMPEVDGFTFIAQLRDSGIRVPAIAFSAYAREEDKQRAQASGFQVHLAKPVDSRTLVQAVASVGGSR